MDFKRNKQFQETFLKEANDKLINILSQVFQLEGEDFVWEMYKQILHREPEPKVLLHLLAQALNFDGKFAFFRNLLHSSEAKFLLWQQNWPGVVKDEVTILKLLREMIHQKQDADFIKACYRHILLRHPKKHERMEIRSQLQNGASRLNIIFSLIQSQECRELLADITSSSVGKQVGDVKGKTKDAGHLTNIGIFIGYSIKIYDFAGEGIGRFVLRLVEGIMQKQDNVVITIAAEALNFPVIHQSFQYLLRSYPGRLRLVKFERIEWLNEKVAVDVWIVPYVGMEPAAFLKRPFILCLHDLVYMHFHEIYENNKAFYDRFHQIVQNVAKNAKKTVFHSEFTKNHEGIKFLQLPPNKTAVIRLAAPKKEYAAVNPLQEKKFRQRYQLYGPYITYPTVFRWHKNIDRLIEAFMQFSRKNKEASMQLVFTDHYVNSPVSGKIKHLLEAEQEENIKKRIRFLGRLPWSEVALLYKYAIGTVIPTLFEGSCPFQMLESLTMDTPVAVSDLEVVREIVADLDALNTFNPYKTEEIEAAIFRLWKDQGLAIAKQKEAIRPALERTWLDVSGDYLAIAKEIMES